MTYRKYENVWLLMKENNFEINLQDFHYLACIKCRNVLINASFPPCGCRYCYDCIKDSDGQHCIGKNEKCKQERLNLNGNIAMDLYINDIILKMEVKCPNPTCEYRGKLKAMPEHCCFNINSLTNSVSGSLKSRSDSGFMSLKHFRSYGWKENMNNEIRQMKKDIEDLKNENTELRKKMNYLLEKDKQFKISHDHFQNANHTNEKGLPKELQLNKPNSEAKFIWKIEKFSEKKSTAQYWFKTEIKSESFFTNPFGYKMRLTVFPNGFGDGKNTHLSVVFCLMKGPHDNCLSWPMKKEISISLINQNTRCSHLCLRYQFRTTVENMKFIYNKPVTDENRGFGTSRFIILTDLIGNEILCKNDTIILTCSVAND